MWPIEKKKALNTTMTEQTLYVNRFQMYGENNVSIIAFQLLSRANVK